jgi:hypothetical protein
VSREGEKYHFQRGEGGKNTVFGPKYRPLEQKHDSAGVNQYTASLTRGIQESGTVGKRERKWKTEKTHQENGKQKKLKRVDLKSESGGRGVQ